MAGLPATTDKSSDLTTYVKWDNLREYVVVALRLGLRPNQMAKRIYPDDPVKQKATRQRIRNMVKGDERLAMMIVADAKGEMMMGLIPATEALTRRAAKGRPDAIKLLYEASGFHNPRVKHEHSGDIKITLESVPRPTFQSDDDDVVDADVVDED